MELIRNFTLAELADDELGDIDALIGNLAPHRITLADGWMELWRCDWQIGQEIQTNVREVRMTPITTRRTA